MGVVILVSSLLSLPAIFYVLIEAVPEYNTLPEFMNTYEFKQFSKFALPVILGISNTFINPVVVHWILSTCNLQKLFKWNEEFERTSKVEIKLDFIEK